MSDHMHLLIPGPVEAAQDVLDAIGSPIIPHYGPQFMALYHETQDLLRRAFLTEGEVLMVPGPGSGIIDMVIGSLIGPSDGLVILNNGFFGNRLVSIAEGYGLHVYPVTAPMGEAITAAQLDAALIDLIPAAEKAGTPLTAVALCHTETSTGVLNPLRELAEIANKHGLAVIVDAVASWGAMPLYVDEWGIDAAISVPNKALAAPAGMAVAAVSQRAWQMAAANPAKHGWYLDLRTWRTYMDEWAWHPYPTTLSSNNIAALNKALKNALAEGLDAFQQSFTTAATRVREGMAQHGFILLPAPQYATATVSALSVPEGLNVSGYIRYLREAHHIMIASGLGDFAKTAVRIGHMGVGGKDPAVIDMLIEATGQYITAEAAVSAN